jgi:hypothetical protein
VDDTQKVIEEKRYLILRESISVEIFNTSEKPIRDWGMLESVSILSSI